MAKSDTTSGQLDIWSDAPPPPGRGILWLSVILTAHRTAIQRPKMQSVFKFSDILFACSKTCFTTNRVFPIAFPISDHESSSQKVLPNV